MALGAYISKATVIAKTKGAQRSTSPRLSSPPVYRDHVRILLLETK